MLPSRAVAAVAARAHLAGGRGGLATAQIAAAFLVPEATIAKRISRAKQRIRDAGARFELPAEPQRGERLCVVLHVLCLVFNEGYTTSSGPALQRPDLTAEAIRLTRLLYRLQPGETEVAGLLALILLTDARRAARTDAGGRIVPLAEQRRDLWDATAIADGQAILTRTLGTGPVGPYQLQAAIAALHDEALTVGQTDWPQILALYDVLATVAPGPLVALSRAVALAMVHGPRAGLALLGTLNAGDRIACSHRLEAVRAHLLEQAGDTVAARQSYLRAARMTASLPEQRYLELRAVRLHRNTLADQPTSLLNRANGRPAAAACMRDGATAWSCGIMVLTVRPGLRHRQGCYVVSRTVLRLRRSLRLARLIAKVMKGAASLENPAGSPRLRSVIRVEPSPTARQV